MSSAQISTFVCNIIFRELRCFWVFFPTRCRTHKELPFDKDWNWLIKIIETVESLGYDFNILTPNVVEITTCEGKNIIYLEQERGTKKESVYKACVMFIQQYNKNK